MKCRRCGKEIEKDLKPIIAMSGVARMYNPNHLCRECMTFSREEPRSM